MGINKENSRLTAAAVLRHHAEKQLQAKTTRLRPPRSEEETQRLVHELEVHQIELDMQNAELCQARIEVETVLEKYTDLYDFAPVGYFTLDRDGVISEVNLSGATLLGIERSRLVGQRFGLFVDDETRSAFIAFLRKVFENRAKESCDVALRKEGNHQLFVQIEAVAAASGQGCRVAVIDITERKWAEEAIRSSEARYRALFRDNPVMIVTLDADLRMLSVNPVCASQLGYTIEELEGESVLKLFHEDDRPAVIEQLQTCLRNPEQVHRWQFRKIRKDGKMLWVEETAQAFNELNGALNLLVVCQDVSERKRLEDELKKTSRQNELILTSAGEGIVGLDLDGNHTFVNAAAAAMLGYDVNDLVGKQSHATWHYARPDGSSYPREECPVYAAYKDGTTHSGADMFLRKDGTFFPVQFTSRPIIIDGEIVGAVLTFNDITEHKEMEDALRESEERFRATFNQAAVGLAHVAPDGRWLRINQKFCDVVGYSEEELTAMTIKEITHPDDQKRSTKQFQLLLQRKLGDYSLEKRYLRKDGSIVWVNLTASMVFDATGKPIFAVGVAEDITRRKRAEEEIKNLNASLAARAAELADVNREQEAFNYTVAHDLRKPLTVVNGYCQAIKESCGNNLGEVCNGYLQEAYDGTLRMNRLIDALLNFSQLTHVEPQRQTVDLSALAQVVVAELQLVEPERRVTFRIADGASADGDAALLRVILDNLLGNAWKYTATREEGIIEFGTTEDDGKTVWFIRDNGNGFDMADADKLFTPFQRLPGAEECRGFGIGLATVERIIKRHGGRVWAEGEPGKGATFYFTL